MINAIQERGISVLRIAICEDINEHRELIKEELSKILEEDYVLKEFSSLEGFRQYYETAQSALDIVLMDIELKDGSGIELSSEINKKCPLAQIIYITSYTEYFSEVYDTAHVWFINKKDLKKYLPRAVQKAYKELYHVKSLLLNISWQKMNYSLVQEEIIFVERRLHVSEIHTLSGIYKTAEKLEILLERLTSAFILCHRSYIINMKNITKIQKNSVVLNGEINIPVSRAKESEVKKAYAMFLVR